MQENIHEPVLQNNVYTGFSKNKKLWMQLTRHYNYLGKNTPIAVLHNNYYKSQCLFV